MNEMRISITAYFVRMGLSLLACALDCPGVFGGAIMGINIGRFWRLVVVVDDDGGGDGVGSWE